MKIYLTGAFEYRDVRVGFGNAADHICHEFDKSGIEYVCKDKDDNSKYDYPVEICFDQPHRFNFSCPDAYRIGYVPWESTEFMPGWLEELKKCDEIWTPNEFGKNVFRKHLPEKRVMVFQHGISSKYRPRKRKIDKDRPFTFLFIGEPQSRKSGQLVADTFIRLFGNNPDYRLIIKATHTSTIMVENPNIPSSPANTRGTPDFFYKNVITITKMMTPEQIIQLYDECDVFVYPSWGEGWGFNPIQALAMGIPVISTYEWSDYAKYITVPIDSTLTRSPWQDIHPGMMYKPNREQFFNAMRDIKDNYSEASRIAFKNSFDIHKNYNWEHVSRVPIRRLKKILNSRT